MFEEFVKQEKQKDDDDDDVDADEDSPCLQAFKRMQIDRVCCRRHLMSNLHIVPQL